MKWFAFTSACVAALIGLGILAVDERDVSWESDGTGRSQPVCPYCRTAVKYYAVVCPECNRSADWVAHRESCRWCLSGEDVEHLEDLFTELKADEEPLPGRLAEFGIGYFNAMDEGTCTYCGGLGEVVAAGAEVACPICRGDKRCVACGGDRVVVIGDPDAHRRWRARLEARTEAKRRADLTKLTLKRGLLVDQDVDVARGYLEAEELVDERDRELLPRARAKLERAFEALHEEIARAGTQDRPRDG